MAKRKGPNKSEAIRNYYRRQPDAKPAKIVAALRKKGISVTAQQVSTCRLNAIKAGLIVDPTSRVKPRKKVHKQIEPAKRNGSFSPKEVKQLRIMVREHGVVSVKELLESVE